MNLKVYPIKIWSKQLGVASLYLLFGMFIHHYIIDHGIVSILWPGSGLALAAVLIGGKRYLWGILLGAFVLNVLSSNSLWVIAGFTLANVLEAYLGAWLLTRKTPPAFHLSSLTNYLRLIGFGGAIAGIAGALIGASSLLFAGLIDPANYFATTLHWWMGDALGVVLLTPFVLAWWQTTSMQRANKQTLETLLLIAVTFIIGQISFLGWFDGYFSHIYTSYFVFALVAWVAVRLDVRWLTLVVLMIASQALLGAYLGIGTFNQDIASSSLQNYWNLMLILSGIGVSLATYVNESKHKELKLQASETLLKEAQHVSQLGNWELNIITGKLVWSDEIFILFEIEKSKFSASYEGFLHAIHPDDRETVNQAYTNALAMHAPYEITHRLLMDDGRIKWVIERCTTYFNNAGKPTRSVGTMQDITAHKLIEDQLRLAAITFETSEAIMITDANANIIRVNQSFEKITGYSELEMIGKNPRILSSGRHDKDFYASIWQELLSVGIWTGEVWDRHKNGSIHPKQLTISAVKDNTGEIRQYVAIFIEISERKNAEAKIRKTEGHLTTILNSLDEVIWTASAPDFNLHHVSAATEKLYGVSQQAFIDDPELWLKSIHPDDKPRVLEATNKIFAVGKTEIEYRIIRSDGEERWLSDRMYVIYDDNHAPVELVGIAYDVTERKTAEDMHLRNQAYLIHMLENSPIAVRITTSAGHKVLFANKRYAKLVNAAPDEMTGKDPKQYYAHPQDYEDILHELSNGASVTDKLVELIIPGGETTWVMASYMLIDYENESAVLGWFYDITNLRAAQEALQVSERQAKQSLEELMYQKFALDKHAIVAVTDVQGYITYANDKFCEISGYSQEELIGQDHAILNSGHQPKGFFKEMYHIVASGKPWHAEVCNRAKDGHLYWVDTTIAPFMGSDGKPQSYISIRTDITQRKLAEEKSNYLAFYDVLTSLPNRRLFVDRLTQALIVSARSGKDGALLFLDLDHFKTLNDTLGHDIGDLLLQQVAQRLTSAVREGDSVARIGGDEFVVLLENLSEHAVEAAAQVETIAEKILASLNQPYQLAAYEYHSTPSIGIALFRDQEHTQEDLLKQADIAMYQAKKAGRNTISFFDPHMQDAINARADIERELRKALELQQFQLYYQIQVNHSGQAIGAEALIRWHHPERGMISPFHFIPLAEETGLILTIGQWILDTACAQLKLWQQNTLTRDLLLAVNVSAKQFLQADFVTQVQSTVQRHGIDPTRLKLELTESMLVDNIKDIITTMAALGETGIRFSLDDFGTGYSSLQYLKNLPLHQLKIDQSFVRDITTDSSDIAIVLTIITMAHSLGLNVIAEGVETEEQRSILLGNGCTHFQGYLFSKPVPIDAFEALLF